MFAFDCGKARWDIHYPYRPVYIEGEGWEERAEKNGDVNTKNTLGGSRVVEHLGQFGHAKWLTTS